MATAPLQSAEYHQVTLETYLRTSYEPDADYIDGHLEERPVGEFDHSRIQTILAHLLYSREREWNILAVTECRLQVAPTRFRVPDIMVLSRDQTPSRIVRTPPLLCIEVMSPEDTWARTRTRIDDYLAMGVQHIWVFDPGTRDAHTCDAAGFHRVTTPGLTIPNTPIHITLAEVFAALPAQE